MVDSEVAFAQVACAVGLIVQTVIGLRIVAEIGRVPVVDDPICAAVVTSFVEGTWNHRSWLRCESILRGKSQFGERVSRLRETLAFPLALNGKKAKQFVLDK